MDTMSAVKLMMDDLKRQKEETAKYFGEKINDLFREFFEANPKIDAIRWEQYTPYFNDGAPCTFGVCEPNFRFVDGVLSEEEAETLSEDGDGFIWSLWGLKDKDRKAELEKIFDGTTQLSQMLCGAEEFLEEVYGDHVRLTVTRAGIEVEEYSHD